MPDSFQIHSHHRFVRRSPDSGGGSLTHLQTCNGVPSSSCARVVVRGFCYPGPSFCPWPRALLSQHYVLWAVSRFSRFQGLCFSLSINSTSLKLLQVHHLPRLSFTSPISTVHLVGSLPITTDLSSLTLYQLTCASSLLHNLATLTPAQVVFCLCDQH